MPYEGGRVQTKAGDLTSGPKWLRQRSLGKLPWNSQQMSPSTELVQRLGQEACLDGHNGCVNCLEWNQNGDLLASGSDDHNVIIWDVFKRKTQSVIKTGHEGTFFSVKFMPSSNDSLVASCAGDGQVRVTSIYQSEKLFSCNLCHTDRVKRLAVHPDEPNLIWSAAEDGLILEHDIRLKHDCDGSRPSNVMVDLRNISACLQAKCIAVNPLRSEMLAVGSNDIYTRLFDRRFVKMNNVNNNNPSMAYFAPGHLLKTSNRSNHIQTYGTTYLSFNSRGTELLASYHAEQIYLFDLCEPSKRYQSFNQTLKPLLLDGQRCKSVLTFKGNSDRKAKRMRGPGWDEHHVDLSDATIPSTISHLNEEISKCQASPAIYRLRSEMLLKRNWRGDDYQALRDCCSALAIDPMDAETIHQLARTLVRLDDLESTARLAEFISVHQHDYGDTQHIEMALGILKDFKHAGAHSIRDYRNGIHCNDTSNIGQPMFIRSRNLFNLETLSDRYKHNKSETQRCSGSHDYIERYCGHCNMNTDIKEASFFGPNDEFIVGGSDDGAFYIWNKATANLVKAVHADHHILNCVQPHPNICMLATSGIESTVKFWSPIGPIRRDVKSLELRCAQNQKFISTDPLEAMIMLLYPDTSHNLN